MTLNQAYNLFLYTGIMLLDNDLMVTSPDYYSDKSCKFFGSLGKSEFINYTKIDWNKYCKLWKVKEDNYELMNVINFLENINPLFRSEQIKNFDIMVEQFKKYMGALSNISEIRMDGVVHHVIRQAINNNIDFNSRYLKLKVIGGLYE